MATQTTITDQTGDGLPQVAGIRLSEAGVTCSLDGKEQPLVVGIPEGLADAEPAPLLVGIHTWSADYRQMVGQFAPLCAHYRWRMLLPNFRGPNLTSNPCPTEAGGSLLAQHEVIEAVGYMKRTYCVDDTRLYMIGGSGGGHMSLLVASKYPELWAGVSAWCPVSDLRDWHAQQNTYAPHIEAVCGGAPGSAETDFEYLRRSPRTFLSNAANTNLQIAHGDKDPVIWVNQTWQTYEVLRPMPHRAEFLSWTGGHDLLPERGFAWLATQVKPSTQPCEQHLVTDEGKWYYWLYLEPEAPLTLARADVVYDPGLPCTITLSVEHAKTTRLRLSDLGLSALCGATRNGEPLALDLWTVDHGILELPPTSGRVEYVFTC